MSSFESMSATLQPVHWGLHGGQAADNCSSTSIFDKICTGKNVMAQRNYPCDNLVYVYFGYTVPEVVGEALFKKQLYMCMLSQALHIKGDIEARRGRNQIGTIIWQLNEIWCGSTG